MAPPAAPSESGLTQHVMLNHFNQVEDEVREQLAAEKERRAVAERARQADPKELRPEERLQDRERP